ncbi:MAG: hypothetical protein HY273_08515 [Gammaproteobacteria bacterium]|nr:hypothetical protein [Gammaproteobacteria bacterium]
MSTPGKNAPQSQPSQAGANDAGNENKPDGQKAGNSAIKQSEATDKQAEPKTNEAAASADSSKNQTAQARQKASNSDDKQRETTQAMEQMLGSVSDDPGGLLREKFRREHLRRAQRGGNP